MRDGLDTAEEHRLLDQRGMMEQSMAWMYILECADGSYYVGSTRNLDERVSQHMSGRGARYTSRRLPVKLVYAEEYDLVREAYFREKQVQGWSRAKREALIRGDYEVLPSLPGKSFANEIA